MKQIILLIHFLTLTFFVQAQEKLNYKLNDKNMEFDLSFLRKGIYFIKAYVSEEIITHKIIR